MNGLGKFSLALSGREYGCSTFFARRRRWHSFSLMEQLANVVSEVGRARRKLDSDPAAAERAWMHALKPLDLTIGDDRWRGRRKELTRTRECLCDAMLGGTEYGTTFESLDGHLLPFAIAARRAREP